MWVGVGVGVGVGVNVSVKCVFLCIVWCDSIFSHSKKNKHK